MRVAEGPGTRGRDPREGDDMKYLLIGIALTLLLEYLESL
jgi:hypothetical protein